MNEYYYGVENINHLTRLIFKVTAAFGGGKDTFNMMLGTCAAETHCGTYPDTHPEAHGVGVGQCDRIALDDVKQHIRPHDKRTLSDLGYDIDDIELEDLAYDPLLALCIMRLVYKRKTEPFPHHTDLEGMARYWKKHYNSYHPNAGGTPEEFISNWQVHVPREFQ